LAVASAVTTHSFSELTSTNSVFTLLSNYPSGSQAPTLSTLTYSPSYDSAQTTTPFTLTGSGTSVGNNTVSSGYITLTGSADTVQIKFNVGTVGNAFTFSGSSYPKLLSTSYSVTATLVTSNFGVYSASLMAAFPNVSPVTPYVPPTLQAVNVVSPQSPCDSNECLVTVNATATINPYRPAQQINLYFNSGAPATGALFYTLAGTGQSGTGTDGSANFARFGTLMVAVIGGVSQGGFVIQEQQSDSTLTMLPTPAGNMYSISAQTEEVVPSGYRTTYYNAAQVGSFQGGVSFTNGATDVTAPTCTVVSFSPVQLTDGGSTTLTVTCNDASLWIKGAFVQLATTSGLGASEVFPVTFASATMSIPIPANVQGTATVIGVFAADNAGNVALYGSCGGISGWDTICGGGGSSSASHAAVSFFALIVLAILAL